MIPSRNQYSSLNRCPGCGGFVEGRAECLACGREAAADAFGGPGREAHRSGARRRPSGPGRDATFHTSMDELIAAVLPPERRPPPAAATYAPVDMVGAAIRRQLSQKAECLGGAAVEIAAEGTIGDGDEGGDPGTTAGGDGIAIPRDGDIFLGRPPDRLQRAFWRANKFIDG
jgi:hypothetical protein